MNFRIADTFTDSLSKLTNDEQKAVKTAAFDLQLNPAIWNYQNYANIALSLWRKGSHHEFNTYCLQNHIGPYDLCPCGSGDKVRFCCEMALK